MITRAQMPRQLRDKGGIASVTPRENYGLGSKIKERFRKLIPNELADVAVKAQSHSFRSFFVFKFLQPNFHFCKHCFFP